MEISEIYNLYKKNCLVDTDTRKIRKNTMFFALKGENFNGNTFAEKALDLGAKYAIVDEKIYASQKNIILVNNALSTLQKLANYHRKKLQIPIIGLTGSNGKTTTKELINAVLSKKYFTKATEGNLNNHIGVPLTLLSMTTKHDLGNVEMGANHQKEIAFLSAICEPDYGYITNFGKAHLEGFGGVKGVIKGKSELYTFLKENNKIAFVNPDDEIQIEKTKNIKTILFDQQNLKFEGVSPFVKLKYKDVIIQSNLIGKYNFSNIAAAIAIGSYFKVEQEEIKDVIENYIPKNNRSQIINKNENTIILDAYNANPSSMVVALENFGMLTNKNKMVILGDMFELGEDSYKEHQAIIDLCNNLNFNKQYFIGQHFYECKTNQQKFKTFADFESYLKKNPLKNLSILIKGSRGMRLERVLDLIN